jgi:hypothetical protein
MDVQVIVAYFKRPVIRLDGLYASRVANNTAKTGSGCLLTTGHRPIPIHNTG